MNRIKDRLNILIVIFILCIFLFPLLSLGQPIRYQRRVDKSTILFLFQHHLFKSLTSKLEEYQSLYDQDYKEEENVFNAFDVFSKVDTSLGELFVAWIKECPGSYVPYEARAKYYCACARQARGRKWKMEKDKKEYKEMEEYYSLSLLDINEALKNNNRSDVCYAMMIEIGSATDNEDMKNRALADALTNHPYAYRIRLKYLETLIPRMGGSYDKMKAFIDSCVKYFEFNPKLKELSASIPADKGNFFSYLGKYEEAIKMYTEAINYSDCQSYYAERGDAYVHLNDYVDALKDYDHALELSPNDPDYLDRKIRTIALQKNQSETKGTNQYVQRSDSNNKRNQDESLISDRILINKHLEKGSKLANEENYEGAITEYSEVIRIAPYEYIPYFNRAICYSRIHNDDAALQDFLRVVELKPDDINTYFRIATIYANRDMYDNALNSINSILSLDPKNGEALYTRGRIYERKGNNIEALQDMHQACDLGYQPACRYYNQVK